MTSAHGQVLQEYAPIIGQPDKITARRKMLNLPRNSSVFQELPLKTIFEPTWALGAQYHLTDTQNISANISRTFRAPDWYERYTFGGFLGGGLALQPEEGYHAEVAWKYLNDHWALNTSVFYSDFDQYIWTKTNRRVIDRAGLESCIRIGKCNIATGDFNDRESDFFQDTTRYYMPTKSIIGVWNSVPIIWMKCMILVFQVVLIN